MEQWLAATETMLGSTRSTTARALSPHTWETPLVLSARPAVHQNVEDPIDQGCGPWGTPTFTYYTTYTTYTSMELRELKKTSEKQVGLNSAYMAAMAVGQRGLITCDKSTVHVLNSQHSHYPLFSMGSIACAKLCPMSQKLDCDKLVNGSGLPGLGESR